MTEMLQCGLFVPELAWCMSNGHFTSLRALRAQWKIRTDPDIVTIDDTRDVFFPLIPAYQNLQENQEQMRERYFTCPETLQTPVESPVRELQNTTRDLSKTSEVLSKLFRCHGGSKFGQRLENQLIRFGALDPNTLHLQNAVPDEKQRGGLLGLYLANKAEAQKELHNTVHIQPISIEIPDEGEIEVMNLQRQGNALSVASCAFSSQQHFVSFEPLTPPETDPHSLTSQTQLASPQLPLATPRTWHQSPAQASSAARTSSPPHPPPARQGSGWGSGAAGAQTPLRQMPSSLALLFTKKHDRPGEP